MADIVQLKEDGVPKYLKTHVEAIDGKEALVQTEGDQAIAGHKNFSGSVTINNKRVLTTDDNKYEVVTLTVTNGNTGSAKLYREGKTVSIYFVALNGKSSGGNDSVILTVPEGYRTPISFEQLVGSIDRSTLNSAQLSIGADGAIKWRRNSSYGSAYSFVITYSI
ncbi:TPA: hypothetical protein IZ499_002072 [Enterococcus faecium]|nr:hypothetical protein [Enterococcus faecium]